MNAEEAEKCYEKGQHYFKAGDYLNVKPNLFPTQYFKGAKIYQQKRSFESNRTRFQTDAHDRGKAEGKAARRAKAL